MHKVPNPMGCTPDKYICSHYNIPLCIVLSVLYVYATSDSLQIISYFIYSYFRVVFQPEMFCIASKMTNEPFFRISVVNLFYFFKAKRMRVVIQSG